MNTFVIWLISIYQRYISPHKGFQCAHAYLHQGDSCSAAVKTIIADQGIIQGYTDIRHRFEACRYAYADIVDEIIRRDKEREEEKRRRSDGYNPCSDACGEIGCNIGSHMCGDISSNVCSEASCDIVPCDCSL